jgi:hypothetical protein
VLEDVRVTYVEKTEHCKDVEVAMSTQEGTVLLLERVVYID